MSSLLRKFFFHSPTTSISQRNIPFDYVARVLAMFMLTQPVRILWMQQFLTNAEISILTGWLFLTTVILELPTGAFADLVGKKITIMAAYIANALSLISFLWAGNFWQFGLVISLEGLGESLLSGAHSAFIYDTLVQDGRQQEFKTIQSKNMSYVQFAMVGGTFLGGLAGSFHLGLPFVLEALMVIAAAIVTFGMIEPSVDTEVFTWSNYKRQTIEGAKHIFHTPKLTKLTILYVLVGGIGWTFQRLLRDMILIFVGFGQVALGLINGGLRLVNILFLRRFISSTKAADKGWDILLLPILMIVSYLPGLWLNQWNAIPLIAGVMMVGTGRFLIFDPYLQHEISSKYRATAMSTANLLVSLVLAINMMALGVILQYVTVKEVLVGYGLFSVIVVLPLALHVRKIVLSGT